MDFASPFDELLAERGPAAVFLCDHKGRWRMEVQWTRDRWGRAPGPHAIGWRFVALRDWDTGFVWVVLSTSPTLLEQHPRADLRLFYTLDEALSERDRWGSPPRCEAPW